MMSETVTIKTPLSRGHRMKRFFLDTEFIEDGKTIELLSIGVVDDEGREFYAENADANWNHASQWVTENVIAHLRGKDSSAWLSHEQIGLDLITFVNATSLVQPEFWAYFSSYDWVVTCQLFGTMRDLPNNWPMFCMDLKQLCVLVGDPQLPPQSTTEHHALADANWTREAYQFLTRPRLQAS